MAEGQTDESLANLLYVRDMLPQLKKVAGLPDEAILSFLLDMAHLQAETEIDRRTAGAPPKNRRPPDARSKKK